MARLSVLLLDTEPRTRNAYITLAVAEALRRDPRVARVVLAEHGTALDTFRREGLDTVIAFGGARVHGPLLTRLAALARLSILWTTEDPYEVDNNVRYGTGFDHVFTNDRSVVEAYGGRAHHLPLAAAPAFQDLAVRTDDAAYRYDLLFIGTAWPNRVRSLNAILAAAPRQLRVKLALPYNAFIGPPDLDDPSAITDWRCGNRDFARFANASRVVLTLPRAFSTSNAARAAGSTPPPRLFETALAGGYQVMVSPEPETRAYYADGAEIRLCADDAEAIAAIGEALADPRTRIARAEAARRRTLAEHLYDHRVARMLDVVGETASTKLAPPLRPRRRTVLYVTHNRAGYRPGGGVEVYQEALGALEARYETLFLFPVLRDDGGVDLHLQGRSVHRTFRAEAIRGGMLTDPAVEGLFEEILLRYEVDLVHFHHLIHLPPSLPLVARACGVPVVYQLHDHYLICERFLLLDYRGRFCDVVHRGSQQCDTCLLAADGHPPGSKTRRDRFIARSVAAVDAFITSTPYTGAYLRGFYPDVPAERVVEIEMLTPGEPVRRAVEADPGAPLRVAVIGNFVGHKGAGDILNLIALAAAYPIQFHVFGYVEPAYRARLEAEAGRRVAITGTYEQAAIIGLVSGCDVSLHLSVWPETFVISLGEAWKAGLVPIVTDLGAMSDRVADGVDGFTVPPNEPGVVLARLLDLHFDRGRLARMRAAVEAKTFIGRQAHLDAVAALYDRLMAEKPCPHDRVPDRVSTRYDLALFDVGVRLNAPRWTSADILDDADYAAALTGVDPATPRAIAPAPVLGALPDAAAGLPERSVALDALAGHWWLDALTIDDRAVEARTGFEVALRVLTLRGWLRTDAERAPRATYLRLAGPTGTAYARLEREFRGDLAADTEDQVSPETGFRGRVELAGLTPGWHDLALVQVLGGQRTTATGLMRLYLAGDLATDRPLAWNAGWSGPAEGPDTIEGPGTIEAVRHNLPMAAGAAVAVGVDVWALSARVPEADAAETVFALLSPAQGGPAWWTRAQVNLSDGRLGFAVRMAGPEPGGYGLALALVEGGRTRVIGTGLDVVVSGDGGRHRLGAEPPAGFLPRSVRREKSGCRLDRAWAEDTAAGPVVRCVGWAFRPGEGALRSSFAAWEEDRRPRVCVSAALPRPDAAAHLDDPGAAEAGIDLAIPEAVLRAGTVRFIQVYAGRSIEYVGFQASLVRLLEG